MKVVAFDKPFEGVDHDPVEEAERGGSRRTLEPPAVDQQASKQP